MLRLVFYARCCCFQGSTDGCAHHMQADISCRNHVFLPTRSKLCCPVLRVGVSLPLWPWFRGTLQPGKFPYNRLSRFTYLSSEPSKTHLSENEILFSFAKASDVHSAGWVGFKPSSYNNPPVRFSYHCSGNRLKRTRV